MKFSKLIVSTTSAKVTKLQIGDEITFLNENELLALKEHLTSRIKEVWCIESPSLNKHDLLKLTSYRMVDETEEDFVKRHIRYVKESLPDTTKIRKHITEWKLFYKCLVSSKLLQDEYIDDVLKRKEEKKQKTVCMNCRFLFAPRNHLGLKMWYDMRCHSAEVIDDGQFDPITGKTTYPNPRDINTNGNCPHYQEK